jgi:putative restriction endonuclease
VATEIQLREAQTTWNALAEFAKDGRSQNYAELSKATGIHHRSFGRILLRVQNACAELALPNLTSIIVKRSTNLPGSGNDVAPEQLPFEQERVWEFDWLRIGNPFTIEMAARDECYGEISGYPEGSFFEDREAVRLAGLHRHGMAGISNPPKQPADAIVVSGGYVDDEDHGDIIIYTGQGGRATQGKPASDQTLTKGNLALMENRDQGVPVRVIRGASGDKKFSPVSGYRYDGLYEVEDGWIDDSRAGKKIYRFRLKKLSAEDGPTWRDAMPTSSKSPSLAPSGTERPERGQTRSTLRVIRDTKVTRWVKELHDFTCQVCGTRLETPASPYAEGAQIRPLGAPHNGSDKVENMLCLCPNCHTLFDRGGLCVDPETMEVQSSINSEIHGTLRQSPDHSIDREAIRYHRKHIAYS